MTLDDRVYIQEGLDNNLNPNLISRKIGKSHSTVLNKTFGCFVKYFSFQS